MIINQKKKYYSSKIEQSVNKPRVIWQIIKQHPSKESSQDTRFSSNELNDYFVNISSNILKQLENTPVDPAKLTSSYTQFHKSIFFMPVDSTEVGHIIANLSDSTSLDVYGLSKIEEHERGPEIRNYPSISSDLEEVGSMRVYKSDGTFTEDSNDTEFGWYFSEIVIDESQPHFEEINKETRVLSKLRKSLTKENVSETIDIPEEIEIAEEVEADSPIRNIKPSFIPDMKKLLFEKLNCASFPKEKLAEIINPCNPETRMLLAVTFFSKYNSLIKEETAEELMKTVNLKTTNFKCLLHEEKLNSAEDMYKEIVNYHATKEDNMLSLMMELILTDVDCEVDDIVTPRKPEPERGPVVPTFVIETSDLGNSIQSSSTSSKCGEQRDYLQVPNNINRSNILSSIGLEEEDKSIQSFCDESYEMHFQLAEIKKSFQEDEDKVNELIKQATALKNDLRETIFLNDLLHLLKGDLEKVKSKKLPFRIFHNQKSDVENLELNLII
ncbi:hypothetical protein JTB14_036392 [Gonioctena quinquepunctata]|nr:hypothetical protein JTB14_036392 [Gonioctena quinquepunctata]